MTEAELLTGEGRDGIFIPLKAIMGLLRSDCIRNRVLSPTLLDAAVQLIESERHLVSTSSAIEMLQRLCIRCKILEAENAELRTSLEHLENLRSKDVARDSGA